MPATLTQPEIERFVELDKKRKELQRQADAFEREAKPLKEKIVAYVEEKGGSDRTTVHCGYVLQLVQAAGRVDWKGEFTLVVGAERVAQLMSACPPTYRLQVEPARAA